MRSYLPCLANKYAHVQIAVIEYSGNDDVLAILDLIGIICSYKSSDRVLNTISYMTFQKFNTCTGLKPLC